MVVETESEFADWSFNVRGDDCYMVGNGTETMTEVVAWVKDSLEIPEGVKVESEEVAQGTAPAVQNKDEDVEGWTKYVLTLES